MATTYSCDLCKKERRYHQLIPVELRDGEHPHAGSVMEDTVDICTECLQVCVRDTGIGLTLKSSMEKSDLFRKFNGPRS